MNGRPLTVRLPEQPPPHVIRFELGSAYEITMDGGKIEIGVEMIGWLHAGRTGNAPVLFFEKGSTVVPLSMALSARNVTKAYQ